MFFRKKHDGAGRDDWVTDAVNLIERVIDDVRDKAVVPLTTVARGLVFGLLAAIIGTSALILMAIGTMRFLDIYLDNLGAPEGVWFAYFVGGAIFVLGGALLLMLARRSVNRAANQEK